MKLVVIPTYNEKENITGLLELVYQFLPDCHVLIVDDASPDGTGELVRILAEEVHTGRLFLLSRAGKLGLGTAYTAGFSWALERNYQYIFQMDADLSHHPRYLPCLLKEAQTSDLVLGSRYVAGGGVENWEWLRRLISKGGSLYSRTILGMPLRDLTGGYKCFRRETLAGLELDSVRSNGYSFQIEMTYRSFLQGLRIKEIPIVFEERAAGKSKMSRAIFMEAVLMVWKLRLMHSKLDRQGGRQSGKIATCASSWLPGGRKP